MRIDQDDPMTQRADALRPGWRGRLRIRAPEESESGETGELIGTIIGYLAGNAQQVVSFCFGSSRGSKAKTDAMTKAFSDVGGNRA